MIQWIEKRDGIAQLNAKGSTLIELLKNPFVWIISLVYFALLMFLWGNLNWLPTYFMKARNSSLLKSGLFSAIPWIGAALGSFVLGWLSDRAIVIKTRSGWVTLSLFAVVPTIIYAVITPDLYISLACFTIASFFGFGAIALCYALNIGNVREGKRRQGQRHYAFSGIVCGDHCAFTHWVRFGNDELV